LQPSNRLRALGCLAACLLFAAPVAHANVILVAASTVGPGGSGCSLVDAINAANNNAATGGCPAGDDKTNGGDVIVLAAGTYKIGSVDNDWYGPNGLPAITSTITLVGDPGGTVIMRSSNTGVQAFRIFYVGGGQLLTNYNPPTDFSALPGPGNLTLINLTIENGLAQGGAGGNSTQGGGGGGLGAGGAIYNQGTLTLQGVTLVGNQALGGAGGNSTTSNANPGGGGGMAGAGDGFGNGGGFNTNGPWPQNTTPTGDFGNGGSASQAGGVGGGGGSQAAGGFGGGGGAGGSGAAGGFGGGGGGPNFGGFGGGFFQGGGAGMGGAIFNEGGTLTLLNCTLTGNNAGGGAGSFAVIGNGEALGSAIFNLNGTVSISFSTLAFNTLAGTTGTTGDGGALYSLQLATPHSPAADAHSAASVTVGSSILYGSTLNTTDSSGNVTSAAATDCVNSSGGFAGSPNALGTTSVTCTVGGDVFPNPLLLLPLAHNGGPTQTMGLVLPLGPGAAAGAPALDQRGYLRITPDIGAYEISNTRKLPPAFGGLQATTLIAGSNASLAWFNLTGNDSTQPAMTLTAISSNTAVLPAANLKLSANCGGSLALDTCSLSLMPTATVTGSANVILSATNGYGQTGYGSFPVSVIPPSPVAKNGSATVASGQTLNGALTATDALTVTLTYAILTQPAHGTLKLTSANSSSYTYTPVAGFIGADSFTWKANDGSTDSNIATISITVTVPQPPPGAPTVSDMSFSVKLNTALKGTLQASGAPLSFAIATQPAHGTVSITGATTGAFTYTPSTGYSGADSFTYTAENTLIKATSNPATVSLTVSVNGTGTQTGTGSGSGSGSGSGANSAAPIASPMTLASYANTPLSNVLTASDAAGDALSFSVTQPGHGAVTLSNATTGAFTYTPAAGYTGSDSFTFTATDTVTKLNSGATTVSITLAGLPVSSTAAPITGNAAFTSYVNVAVSGSLSASDAAGNALSYTLVTPPAHGTATVTSSTGAFIYTPATGYTGSDSFTFTATDSISGVVSSAATISLTLIALPPPAPAPPAVSATSFSTYENAVISGNLTASDAAGNAVTYASPTLPTHGTLTALNTTTGAFTYTPSAGYIGPDGFTFSATDGVASPPLTSATATVLITVNALPPPAPVAGALSVTTYENITVSGVLPASDGGGHAMTYAKVTSPADGTLTLTAATGAFSYVPNASFIGSDSMTYTVTDTTTGIVSAPATVTFSVSPEPTVSPAPLANSAAVILYENTPLSSTLSGVPTANSDILSYAVATPPSHGTITALNTSTGAYTYTPTPSYAGPDIFTFTVKDMTTGRTSAAARIVITVASVPIPATPPQASSASLTLYTGQVLSGKLVAVGTTTDALGYSVVQPSHGTVNLTDATTGTFTYTPNSGYTGSDSFTFTAVDTVNSAASNVATINLTISALPLAGVPPLASGANLSVYSGQPLSGKLAAVDAVANPLSYAAMSQPAHGSLEITAASGAYTYTPTSGYAGKDSFTFAATDTVTHLVSGAASMDITVVSPPLASVAPLANGLSLTVYAGQPLTSVLSAVDVNGNPVSYAITTQPKNGSVALTATSGEFVYTPAGGYTGSDSFAYTATDTTSKLASSAANVALTVVPGPLTPVHHGGPAIGKGAYGLMYLLILVMLLGWRLARSSLARARGRCLTLLAAGCVLLSSAGALSAAEPAADAGDTPIVNTPIFDAWYVGVQASLIKPDSKRDSAARGLKGWGILVGKEFGDYSLEFSAAYHADTPRDLPSLANWKTYGADGLWYFTHRQSNLFTPFAFAGLGLADQYHGDDSKVRSAYGNIGIGFDSTPWQSIPLKFRVDAQLQHVFSGYNDLVVSLGLAFTFGGTVPPPNPIDMPVASPLQQYPMAWCKANGGTPFETADGWVCNDLPPSATPPPCAPAAATAEQAVSADRPAASCPPR
jgi:hypothetical protein